MQGLLLLQLQVLGQEVELQEQLPQQPLVYPAKDEAKLQTVTVETKYIAQHEISVKYFSDGHGSMQPGLKKFKDLRKWNGSCTK